MENCETTMKKTDLTVFHQELVNTYPEMIEKEKLQQDIQEWIDTEQVILIPLDVALRAADN